MCLKCMYQAMQETQTFKEHGSILLFNLAVFMTPATMFMLLILPHRIGWLATLIFAILLCIFSFMVLVRYERTFETSGSKSVKSALKTTHLAIGLGIFGVIYIGLYAVSIITGYV